MIEEGLQGNWAQVLVYRQQMVKRLLFEEAQRVPGQVGRVPNGQLQRVGFGGPSEEDL
jgi:hypothetical protein